MPKSGDVAEKVVKVGITHVLTKMGLMGIQLRIALKNEIPQEFELSEVSLIDSQMKSQTTIDTKSLPQILPDQATTTKQTEGQEALAAGGKTNGQS
jgi:small subunit ribosomal protein S3